MHRLDSRSYVGEPGETVTVTTQLDGGATVSVTVHGQDLGTGGQFTLPSTPGERLKMQVALAGSLGASCVVTIVEVDGGSDTDFLICQAHDPAPVHFYTFSVAASAAVANFARAVGKSRVKPSRTRTAGAKK
jgi:hypothetical protein